MGWNFMEKALKEHYYLNQTKPIPPPSFSTHKIWEAWKPTIKFLFGKRKQKQITKTNIGNTETVQKYIVE